MGLVDRQDRNGQRCWWLRQAWLALALTALAAGMPDDARAEDRWWGADKGMHFGASLVITAGGHAVSGLWLDETWQRAVAGASLGLGAGVGKELWDLAGHGDPSWRDLTWDVVGVATGTGLALLVEALWFNDEDGTAVGGAPLTIRMEF